MTYIITVSLTSAAKGAKQLFVFLKGLFFGSFGILPFAAQNINCAKFPFWLNFLRRVPRLFRRVPRAKNFRSLRTVLKGCYETDSAAIAPIPSAAMVPVSFSLMSLFMTLRMAAKK